MSKKLFAIQCNGKDLYRIKKRRRKHAKNRMILERVGPDGWHTMDNEPMERGQATVVMAKRLLERTYKMYGSPYPTKISVYNDMGPVYPGNFEERYVPDELNKDGRTFRVNYDDVEVIEE